MSESNSAENSPESPTENETQDKSIDKKGEEHSSAPIRASSGLVAIQIGLIGAFTAVLWYTTESVLISAIGGVIFGFLVMAVVAYFLFKFAANKLNETLGGGLIN